MSPQPALALVEPDAPQQVTRPTLFLARFPIPDPETFADLAAVKARLRELFGPGEFSLVLGRVDFPGWADAAAISVRIGGVMAACVAAPWRTHRDHAAARDELRRLLG